MRLDDAGYVGHKAVTYLDRAPVEYFAEFGSFGEVLVDVGAASLNASISHDMSDIRLLRAGS